MPRSDRPSSFLLDFDELFAIEAVGALTTLEVGVFIRLLRRAWNATPPATLPNNDRTLAQWGEVSIVQWGVMSLSVRSCFELGDNGRLISRYLLAKYETAQQKRREGRERAQRARTQREPSANPSNSLSESSGSPSGEWFSKFWSAWPSHVRKVNRKGCETHWRARGVEANGAAVVAAVARWRGSAEWAKDGGQYIPLPLTWLRQERWLVTEIPQAGDDGEHGGPAFARTKTSADEMDAIWAEGS